MMEEKRKRFRRDLEALAESSAFGGGSLESLCTILLQRCEDLELCSSVLKDDKTLLALENALQGSIDGCIDAHVGCTVLQVARKLTCATSLALTSLDTDCRLIEETAFLRENMRTLLEKKSILSHVSTLAVQGTLLEGASLMANGPVAVRALELFIRLIHGDMDIGLTKPSSLQQDRNQDDDDASNLTTIARKVARKGLRWILRITSDESAEGHVSKALCFRYVELCLSLFAKKSRSGDGQREGSVKESAGLAFESWVKPRLLKLLLTAKGGFYQSIWACVDQWTGSSRASSKFSADACQLLSSAFPHFVLGLLNRFDERKARIFRNLVDVNKGTGQYMDVVLTLLRHDALVLTDWEQIKAVLPLLRDLRLADKSTRETVKSFLREVHCVQQQAPSRPVLPNRDNTAGFRGKQGGFGGRRGVIYRDPNKEGEAEERKQQTEEQVVLLLTGERKCQVQEFLLKILREELGRKDFSTYQEAALDPRVRSLVILEKNGDNSLSEKLDQTLSWLKQHLHITADQAAEEEFLQLATRWHRVPAT